MIGSYPTLQSSKAVSQWNDKSGNDNHATQTTATDQPTITTSGMSGKAGLDFDNDKLSIPEIDMAGKTLFAVIQPDTYQRITILSHSSTNVQLRLDSNNKLEYVANHRFTLVEQQAQEPLQTIKPPSFPSSSIILWDSRSTVLFRTAE